MALPQPTSPPIDLLDMRAVLDKLSVSERTYKKLIATGELPSVMLGGRRLVRSDQLVAFIENLPTGRVQEDH